MSSSSEKKPSFLQTIPSYKPNLHINQFSNCGLVVDHESVDFAGSHWFYPAENWLNLEESLSEFERFFEKVEKNIETDSLSVSFLNPIKGLEPDCHQAFYWFLVRLKKYRSDPFLKPKRFFWYSDEDASENLQKMLEILEPDCLESFHFMKGEMKDIDFLMEWKSVKCLQLRTTVERICFEEFAHLEYVEIENNTFSIEDLVKVVKNFTTTDLPIYSKFIFKCKFENDELMENMVMSENYDYFEDDCFFFKTPNRDRRLRVHSFGGALEGWIISSSSQNNFLTDIENLEE